MKVYMGPFRHWYSAYSAIEKPYFHWKYKDAYYDIDDKDHDWLDKAVVWFADKIAQPVFNWTLNIPHKYFNRTVKVRIDRYDTWGMDMTLAPIILPMLKQLKAEQHGAPNVKDEDVPDHLKAENAVGPVEQYSCTDPHYFQRWAWALDEMIWAFEQILDEDAEDQFHTGVSDITWVKEEGMRRMEQGPNHTRKFDHAGYKAWNERITRGTTLFGKYYRNLWD